MNIARDTLWNIMKRNVTTNGFKLVHVCLRKALVLVPEFVGEGNIFQNARAHHVRDGQRSKPLHLAYAVDHRYGNIVK